MKADNEKRLAAETHRKVGIVGVVGDAGIGRLAQPFVLVGQRLQPVPHTLFKLRLRFWRALLKNNYQRLKEVWRSAIVAAQREQRR